MPTPTAPRRGTPPAQTMPRPDVQPIQPVRFISTVKMPLFRPWSAEEWQAGCPLAAGEGGGLATVLLRPAASAQRQPVVSEGLPPRRMAIAESQDKPNKELETLLSEPTTPPERPDADATTASAGAAAAAVSAEAGGDPTWQEQRKGGNAGALARSDSDWADAGYVLLAAEDLENEVVQEMVTDWGAVGYSQLPDGGTAPAPGARLAAQDGSASFGRWVMLRENPSPLTLTVPRALSSSGSSIDGAGGYMRIGSPAPSLDGSPKRLSVSRLMISPAPEDEDLSDSGSDTFKLDSPVSFRLQNDMDSPGSGEGALPKKELDVSTHAPRPPRLDI